MLAPFSTAQAATVTLFDDDFTADSAGVSGFVTVTDLTRWTVTQGNVDILGSAFGCTGCIDLDGTASPATAIIETKDTFDFLGGVTYTFQLFFSGGTEAEEVTLSLSGGSISEVHGNGASVFDAFASWPSDFSSTIRIGVGGPVNNLGPYLDRVLVTYEAAVIPLPAAAPLLLAGLVAMGALALRRRRRHG
jgi:hypothetical protein